MICAFTNCNKEGNNDVIIKIINEEGCFCDTHLKEMQKDDLINIIKPISLIVQ